MCSTRLDLGQVDFRLASPSKSGKLIGMMRGCGNAAKETPTRAFGWKSWLFLVGLVAAVFLVYQPAWHGGYLFDDNQHVTRPELRSLHGLHRIWFEIGTFDRYYPLLDSLFWFQHRLWGDALGYHLVNLALHSAAAILMLLILRRLKVPGAYLAAAIFALHPVNVESVAWISELKNTLSGVFFLSAIFVYLRFDQTRKLTWYFCAFGLFGLALLSKTTAVMLPAVLPVILWWQRGRLSLKKDLLPLIPFFLCSAIAGLLTIWVERNLAGAVSELANLTLVERGLIAGRAIWFYLGKLIWPVNLMLVYPRWQISSGAGWQYLFPVAVGILLALVWRLRRWSRGPVAGILFFVITLFPLLGFLNLNFFRYSFVADHFQYLASLGIITLFSAGATLLLRRKLMGQISGVALVAVLAGLSWQQSRMYADSEPLYRTTIERNHESWLAHNNLGIALMEHGQEAEAMAEYHAALRIKPDYAEAHNNLGVILLRRGQEAEAMAEYQMALRIKPDYAVAHNNLGLVLVDRGQITEAIEQYQTALKIKPDYIEARWNLKIAEIIRSKQPSN